MSIEEMQQWTRNGSHSVLSNVIDTFRQAFEWFAVNQPSLDRDLASLSTLRLSSSSRNPLAAAALSTSPPFDFDPNICVFNSLASCVTVFPLSSFFCIPCRLRLSFNRLIPSPPLSASRCRCAFAFAALMLVRAYTNSMQAMVNAATGATTVLLFKGRGNGLFGDGGVGALAGTEASVVPPGPRGCDSLAPMVNSKCCSTLLV